MNICKQSFTKLGSINRSGITNVVRSFSSVVNSAENKQIEDEADKLYKYLDLELRGNDPAVLKSYAKFSTMAGSYLDVEGKSWAQRKPQHDRLTLLKSVHIYKKHRVQYEFRTYFHFIKFAHLTGSTADTLLEYLERNLPEGVALKATKVELQGIPDHIKPHE